MWFYLISGVILVFLLYTWFSKKGTLEPQPKQFSYKTFDDNDEPSAFSITTFNTLADMFTLFHSYTRPSYLHFNYRFPLIKSFLKELDSDFIALQEVDKCQEFSSFLSSIDYRSNFIERGSMHARDGLVLAWKWKKYHQVETKRIDYNSHWKCGKNMNYRKDNVGFVSVFEERQSKKLIIIACTHLYWDPKLEYVKYAQASMLIDEILKMKDKYQCPVAICGDFNSMPFSNVLNLFYGKPWKPAGNEEIDSEIESLKIKPWFKFRSAYEKYDGKAHPKFTNFTMKFSGCIDYIFHTFELKPKRILILPNEEKVAKELALPNSQYPSDHLPLKVEFSMSS